MCNTTFNSLHGKIKETWRWWLFVAIIILSTGKAPAQTGDVCNAPNILSGKTFKIGDVIYSPGWTPSGNYSCTLRNDSLLLRLGDATSDVWQAQFFFSVVPEFGLTEEKEYCISFDIETNVDLPRALIKFFRNGDNDHFIELESASVKAGKQTVSGIVRNAGETTISHIDKVLYDFGGNPANTTIKISNIAIHGSGEASIDNNITKNKVTVAPNPVKGIMYIHGLQGEIRVRILNASGAVCLDQISNGEVDTAGLVPGIYFVIVNDRTLKIIKEAVN